MVNKNIVKKVLLRLLIVAVPLIVWYFIFQSGIEANNLKEHKTDVGLGFAILLFFILLIFAIGFSIDFIKSIYKKQFETVIIDAPFLLFFLIPVLYIHCQMGGCCEGFCNWYINLFNF